MDAEFLNMTIQVRKNRIAETVVNVSFSCGGLAIEQADIELKSLLDFRDKVQAAATMGQRLTDEIKEFGGKIYEVTLQDAVKQLLDQARTQNQKPRIGLLIQTPELRGVPWEALGPANGLTLAERGDELCIVRIPVQPSGQDKPKPLPSRDTQGLRLRILIIAAEENDAEGLLQSLAPLADAGWIELCEPLVGTKASGRYLDKILTDRLDNQENINVIHYVGHGTTAAFFDAKGERLPADWLANVLKGLKKRSTSLRLVFLQSCKSAAAGTYWSTAEVITERTNIPAIAHLFEVETSRSHLHAAAFYEKLVQNEDSRGDVGLALQLSRLRLSRNGADAFSPVIYAPSIETKVFEHLPDHPTVTHSSATAVNGALDPDIGSILFNNATAPFSMVLGDLDELKYAVDEGLRKVLVETLVQNAQMPEAELQRLSLSMLAQRFAMFHASTPFSQIFQENMQQFIAASSKPTFLDSLAKCIPPGVHVTLTWLPTLERALAKHHPNRLILVAAPKIDNNRLVWTLWRREPGAKDFQTDRSKWETLTTIPANSYFVFRLRGGYSESNAVVTFQEPVVTEDAHIDWLANLADFPSDLREELRRQIADRPTVCLALTALSWRHRLMLRRLLGRGAVSKSCLVLLDPLRYAGEATAWAHIDASNTNRVFKVKPVDFDALGQQLDDFAASEGRT